MENNIEHSPHRYVLYVLALRYLYYCKNISHVPDWFYDKIESEVKPHDTQNLLEGVPSDRESDYSDEVVALANKMRSREKTSSGSNR